MTQGPANLTGVWIGRYAYPFRAPAVDFTATLIDTGASLSGTTHEVCPMHGQRTAILAGSRDGQSVTFVKTYDPAAQDDQSIVYQGALSADGAHIVGRWTIRSHMTGSFTMQREMRKAAARRRKVEERV